jgi:hypothetical protein
VVGSRVHLDGWAEREREGGRGGAEFVVGAVHEGGGAGGPVGGQREERASRRGRGVGVKYMKSKKSGPHTSSEHGFVLMYSLGTRFLGQSLHLVPLVNYREK